jgi:hypothetical protein
MLLAMGFTGETAGRLKEKWIAKFNASEGQSETKARQGEPKREPGDDRHLIVRTDTGVPTADSRGCGELLWEAAPRCST